MLPQPRCRDGIGQRSPFHPKRQANIWHRPLGRVRNDADQLAIPHLRRCESLGDGVDRAAWHARLTHPRQPVRPAFRCEDAAHQLQNVVSVPNPPWRRREFRVVRQVLAIQHPRRQAVPGAVIGAGDIDRPVRRLERRRGDGVAAVVAESCRLLAADQVVQRVESDHRHGGVEQGIFDVLAATQPLPRKQGGKHGVAGHHRRAHVHDRRAGAQADAISLSVHRHEAAFGLGDGVEAEAILQRSTASVCGN